MASDEVDRDEVDRLVKLLASNRKAPAPPAPQPATPSSAPSAPPVAAASSAPSTATTTPPRGKPWTTSRLLMPQTRSGEPQRRVMALASGFQMPSLPRIPRLALPVLTTAQQDAIVARMFVALGVGLSAAMPYWPYVNACSWGLGMYLTSVALLIVTGIWSAKLTWDARLGWSHSISVAVICWGLALIAATALPRIGYAASPAMWVCS